MRTKIFYGIILCLLLGGGYFMYQKFSGSDNKFDFTLWESNEIAPKEQWQEILIGRWEFFIEFKSFQKIKEFIGEIEYKQDGTFKKFLTLKTYGSEFTDVAANKKKSNINIIAGGSVEGKWKVNDDMTWEEKYAKCSLTVSYVGEYGNKDYNPCDNNFMSGDSKATYGSEVTDYSKDVIKTFSKKKIKIEGKTYSDEGLRTLILKKIE